MIAHIAPLTGSAGHENVVAGGCVGNDTEELKKLRNRSLKTTAMSPRSSQKLKFSGNRRSDANSACGLRAAG